MSKCCECGTEISDEEKEKVIDDFTNELYDVMDKYGQVPLTAQAALFIAIAKDLICSKRMASYTFTLGLLQEMLSEGLKDRWEEYHLEGEGKELPIDETLSKVLKE